MHSKPNFYCGSCLVVCIGVCFIALVLAPNGIIAMLENYNTRQENKHQEYIKTHQPPTGSPSFGEVFEIADVDKTIGSCLEHVYLHNTVVQKLTAYHQPTNLRDTIVYNIQELKEALRELRINDHTYTGIFTSPKQFLSFISQYNQNEDVYTCLVQHNETFKAVFNTHMLFLAQRPPNSCHFDLDNETQPSTLTKNRTTNDLYISIAHSDSCPSIHDTFGISASKPNPVMQLFAIPKIDYDKLYFETYEVLPF